MAELIGRVCTKLLGREAGRTCVIVDEIEGNFVLIDGNLRRRKCNLGHLEISEKILNVKKNASTSEVHAAMKTSGIITTERKKSKSSTVKPKKIRKEKVNISNETLKKPSTKKTDGSKNRNSK